MNAEPKRDWSGATIYAPVVLAIAILGAILGLRAAHKPEPTPPPSQPQTVTIPYPTVVGSTPAAQPTPTMNWAQSEEFRNYPVELRYAHGWTPRRQPTGELQGPDTAAYVCSRLAQLLIGSQKWEPGQIPNLAWQEPGTSTTVQIVSIDPGEWTRWQIFVKEDGENVIRE